MQLVMAHLPCLELDVLQANSLKVCYVDLITFSNCLAEIVGSVQSLLT